VATKATGDESGGVKSSVPFENCLNFKTDLRFYIHICSIA